MTNKEFYETHKNLKFKYVNKKCSLEYYLGIDVENNFKLAGYCECGSKDCDWVYVYAQQQDNIQTYSIRMEHLKLYNEIDPRKLETVLNIIKTKMVGSNIIK